MERQSVCVVILIKLVCIIFYILINLCERYRFHHHHHHHHRLQHQVTSKPNKMHQCGLSIMTQKILILDII